ncbi:patatin-like phospholipase family protein [Flavobacterium hercynium]|uniref:PNPLA domain-containing protein n=1 Tax=Flavobacterium hercynium TaxID=387094 RepID=A0A226HLV9_9FLAO|nr:patatin-like phospholipase family protein [Flavobacterium hercynium]OXA94838.1 hypothetical protein B0A66_03675 [Flavobacterium hercynium]
MKYLISCVLVVCSLQFGFSQKKIKLFSEIQYDTIPSVSLRDYKSIQERDAKYQNPNIALGIGISGGGSRSQFFSMGVLLGLEEIEEKKSSRNFLTEIDYFSTVSGGCFSAGYYLAILKNKLYQDKISFNKFYFSKGSAYKDYVDKSAGILTLLNNYKNERGEKISMSQRLDFEVLQYDRDNPDNPEKFNQQMVLSDFFIAKDSQNKPYLPIMVANGSAYNNGERIPFMPHIIRGLKLESSLAPNKGILSLNENQINNGYDFPLTYGITASSAFPGVLPKVKFGIKDKEKILCIVDGGVSDNTGYKTLLELLKSDNAVDNRNKKALFIDCIGRGKKSPYISDKKIGLFTLLETASLYTVYTKYITFEKDLQRMLEQYNIPVSNYQIIGFNTLRDHLRKLEKDQPYENLVIELKNTNNDAASWQKLYQRFRFELINNFGEGNFKKDLNGNVNLATLNRDKFAKLSPSQILVLYEYTSHVETKLRIEPIEREMLLLSGRYATFLKTAQLKELLVEHT